MSDVSYDNACHFVFDIETYGIKNDAAIIQIGFVIVEPDANGQLQKTKGWSAAIDVESQIAANVGNQEPKTIEFWEQNKQALDQILNEQINPRVDFKDAITAIADIVKKYRDQYKAVYFWSRGPDFDYRLIASHIDKLLNTEPFWDYWEVRDIRTIANPLIMNCGYTKNNHDAYQDALNEADDLIKAINAIVEMKK